MTHFLKQYGGTEGPLGLPMQDRQAFQLEGILAALPHEDRALRGYTESCSLPKML